MSETAKPRAELNRARRFDIETVLRFRRGQGLIDEGSEALFLQAVAPHLIALAADGKERDAVASWTRRRCPRLVARRGDAWVEAYAAAASTLRFLNAQALGNLLCLTERERSLLGISTAWVAGWSQAQYERQRRAGKAASACRARERNGATPRSLSVAALKPWDVEGIGRAAWYAKHPPEEREAIVARLRGRVRGHQTSPSGREGMPLARNELVQTVQPRVAAGAPLGAPDTPTPAVELDVRDVGPTSAPRAERRPRGTISSLALSGVLVRVLTPTGRDSSRSPQSEIDLAAGGRGRDLTLWRPVSSRSSSRLGAAP